MLCCLNSCNSDEGSEPEPEVTRELTVSVNSIDFGNIVQNASSEVESYELTVSNIESTVNLTSQNGFVISKTEDGTFGESLSLTSADFEADKCLVYVHVSEQTKSGIIQGQITHSAEGLAEDVEVTALAIIVDAPPSDLQWVENFDYSGDMLSAESNTNSGASNLEMSSDVWIAVKPDVDGIALTDEALTFSGYPSSDLGATVRLFTDGTDATLDSYARNLNAPITMDESYKVTSDHSTVYVSFLYKLEENHTSKLTFPVSIGQWSEAGTTDFNTRAIVDVVEGKNARIGVQFAGSSSRQFVEDVIEVGKTYLIVLKNEKFDGLDVNDQGSVYVFETGTTIPTEEPDPTVQTESPVKRQTQLVILNESNAVNNSLIGGMRVSTSWQGLF